MNTASILKASAAYGGPAVFAAGLAMVTAAAIGMSGSGLPAAQARPSVTVTMTGTQAPVARTTSPTPSALPSSARAEEPRVVAVAAPHTPSGDSSRLRPSGVAPSGPSPAPRPPAAGSPAVDVRAAARLSRPLGVLPEASAGLDLTIGDRR